MLKKQKKLAHGYGIVGRFLGRGRWLFQLRVSTLSVLPRKLVDNNFAWLSLCEYFNILFIFVV